MTVVYSFDVFDTCLVRTVARPSDLFFLLAGRVLPPSATPDQQAELARLRLQAETAARQASPREDITLADIYRHFEQLPYWDIPAGHMMQAEIQLEQESLRPVAHIRQKIRRLRQPGQPIIFISDMYLPPAVIRALLLDHGLAQPDDSIYVSGEIGLTKSSGRLFDYVLNQEAIAAGQLWHTGDHPYADVIVPARRGIKTTLFQVSQLNRYERTMVAQPGPHPWLQTQLAGISRATRLAHYSDDQGPALTDFAAGVAGPLLVAFVLWVLTDARRRGIDRLYFVARDGQILWKIAQKLAETISPAPECRYLYGSRQAWLLPSLFNCNEQELDWLFLHATTPASLLKKLEIQPAEVEASLRQYNFNGDQLDQPLHAAGFSRFWQLITDARMSTLILQKAAQARQTTLAYFEQEGLFSSSWALVDVGWALRGQRAVKKILDSARPDVEIYGYYLALADSRRPMAETGPYSTFLLAAGPPLSTSALRMVLNNTILMEHLFLMADHGTTVGYRPTAGRIEPVLGANRLMEAQPDFVRHFHTTLLQYVSELSHLDPLASYQADLRYTALCLLKTFLTNPDRPEAAMAATIPTVIDQTHRQTHYRFLAKPLGLTDIAYLLKYFVARFLLRQPDRPYSPDYDWLAGSLALSSWWVRSLFLPLGWGWRFKQSNGRWRLYQKWARLVAKETL